MGDGERAHALLSASSAHRWLYCTPSARLEEEFPDTTSEAAKEGSLAHELCEMKVENYFYTVDFGKRKLNSGINKLKKSELWQDEMMGYTDEYLDYIKTMALAMDSTPYVAIEKRVDFSSWVSEGFGTADCILISGGTIHIIDFKYGKSPDGRVSAEGNPQLALYALGAYESYKLLYPIKHVKMSIVQPRLPDGISEWECPVEELLTFGDYVRGRAALAVKGDGDFAPGVKTCRFCRVNGRCRARADKNLEIAFAIGKLPPLISNEEMGQYLKTGTDVAKWLSALQDCALKECLAGKEVLGWKAVEGRGARDWIDRELAFSKLTEKGISEVVLWEKKPLTLAQVEKVVGKKDFAEYVGALVVKHPGKPTLAIESDKREAITNKITADEAFPVKGESENE